MECIGYLSLKIGFKVTDNINIKTENILKWDNHLLKSIR